MRAVKAACQLRRLLYTKPSILQTNTHEVSVLFFNQYSKFSYENRIKSDPDIQQRSPEHFYSPADPDNFGLISRTNQIFTQKYENDEGDIEEEKFIYENPKKIPKLSTKMYADLIKDHLENKRLKEALDILEVKMLQEDKKSPENYIYNLLIDGCGEAGYTKKAFMLFNDMKERGLKTTGATYTSLFKACANSPWPEDGLTRAKKLRILMKEKVIEPNLTTYNCMIKTFGRCGDIVTAFSIVDEMISKKIKIRVHTFNFLLQACISNKERGFHFALVTWRKMLLAREKPNIYSFNLMIRCAKECNLGINNLETITGEVLSQISSPKMDEVQNSSLQNHTLHIGPQSTSVDDSSKLFDQISIPDQSPNLIAKVPHMGSVISIGNISTSIDRFTLMGGLDGFLKELKDANVLPDIKTFTQLLDVIPNTLEYDEKILSVMKSTDLQIDIDFFNVLIKRRCTRFDYKSAKDVELLIDEENKKINKKFKWFSRRKMMVRPDIITYGVWALCCRTEQDAKEFLENMKSEKLKLNAQILGAMLNNAAFNLDIGYVMFLMRITIEEAVVLNEIFFTHLNKFNRKCKHTLNNKDEFSVGPDFNEKYASYKLYYTNWIKKVIKAESDEEIHPWAQFKVNQPKSFQKSFGKMKPKQMYKKKKRVMKKYVVRM